MDPSNYVEIAKNGVMGCVWLITIVPLALAYRAQSKELKETQDRRAVDAQATVDKLLALNDRWNSTVADQVRTVSAIGVTMLDLRHALDGIRELMMRDAK